MSLRTAFQTTAQRPTKPRQTNRTPMIFSALMPIST